MDNRGSTTRALGRAQGPRRWRCWRWPPDATRRQHHQGDRRRRAGTCGRQHVGGEGCVPDPLAVANTKPSATTTDKLPADLVTKLDARSSGRLREAATRGDRRRPDSAGHLDPGIRTGGPDDQGADDHRHARPDRVADQDVHGTMVMQQIEAGRSRWTTRSRSTCRESPTATRSPSSCWASCRAGWPATRRTQLHQDAVRPPGDGGLHARPADRVRRRQITGLPAGREVRLLQHQHAAARQVLEKVTGKPLAQLYQDQLFTPLGMTNTSAPGATRRCRTRTPKGSRCRASRRRRRPSTPRTGTRPGPGGRRAHRERRRHAHVRTRGRHRSGPDVRTDPGDQAQPGSRAGGVRLPDGLRRRVGRPRRHAPGVQHDPLLRRDDGLDRRGRESAATSTPATAPSRRR